MPRYTMKGYGNGQKGGSLVYSGHNPNQEGGANTRTRATTRSMTRIDAMPSVLEEEPSTSRAVARPRRGNWGFLKKQPQRRRNRDVETDADRFLKMAGCMRKGNKKTHWHKALTPFQLHGANAGKIRNTNKARMLLYSLYVAFEKMRRGRRDPVYADILAGRDIDSLNNNPKDFFF